MIVESERDVLGPGDKIRIDTHLLLNPAFRLDSWYWFRKGERAGIPKAELQNRERSRTWRSHLMGRPFEDRIEARLGEYSLQVLEGGNVDRFVCVRKDDTMFKVLDYHMALCFELPISRVTTPYFDVAHWHAKKLFRACMELTSRDPFKGDDDVGIWSLTV
ncbi:hypothetical protein M404DRAFT_30516 [Pisolithus tinctorius Marx 270]|uniref:Uncharacterized protein n=1 Tax=Pisolithus tinctorius Marx 270 TaxID=870435 RepID=A0A0C3NVN9_PISTI|nr:hypothetical protein M404DRAFT_30516 [Pisolithus tinctorius Marx 270]